jgi:hypothetical protein
VLQSDSGLAVSDPTRAKEMTAINSVSNKHPALKRHLRCRTVDFSKGNDKPSSSATMVSVSPLHKFLTSGKGRHNQS